MNFYHVDEVTKEIIQFMSVIERPKNIDYVYRPKCPIQLISCQLSNNASLRFTEKFIIDPVIEMNGIRRGTYISKDIQKFI